MNQNHRDIKFRLLLPSATAAAPTQLTVYKIVVRLDDSLVESPRVRCRLKCETVPLLSGAPVVECWHDFVVLKIAVDNAAENHLKWQWQKWQLARWSAVQRMGNYRLIWYSLPVNDVFVPADIGHASTLANGDVGEAPALQRKPSFSTFVTSHHLRANFN